MDKTELFFRESQNKTVFERREKRSGGKKVKIRMTLSLCLSMLGEKVKTLVLWKHTNSRCFKDIKKRSII